MTPYERRLNAYIWGSELISSRTRFTNPPHACATKLWFCLCRLFSSKYVAWLQ